MDGKSLTPPEEKLKQLKQILPEAFTEGKVDWEKLQATLGEDINFSNERYVLNWAGKSDAFKAMQQPSTRTLMPAKDESIDFDNTQNIFIEGENLEVLKILQKSYFGKVKMIYIDPPYNTGNDSFIYPDKFSETKSEYQRRVGDKDEEGYMTKEGLFHTNSKEGGQYHSNWLNMMYPRLFLAKNLLKQDGVIFVSIDDHEVHNLRLLMNEVFGEECFLTSLIWKRRQNVDSRSKNGASTDHEYLLCYGRTVGSRITGAAKDLTKYSNPDSDPKGDWMSADMTGLATIDQRPNLHYDLTDPKTGITYPCPPTGWRYEPKRMDKLKKNNEVLYPRKKDGRPRRKKFLNDLESDVTGFSSILKTVYNTQGTREVRDLFDGKEYFDFPKPKDLIKRIISQGVSNSNEIVLDFFAGSATTAHAVMDYNRTNDRSCQYICVQLPEMCSSKGEAFKVGFSSIADIAKERIRKSATQVLLSAKADIQSNKNKIKEAENELELPDNQEKINGLREDNIRLKKLDLGFKVLKLADSNFKQWQMVGKNAATLAEQMKLFVDPVSKNASVENMVYELLLKSGKDINSSIEQKDGFCLINRTELALLLEKADQSIIDRVLKAKPAKVIALDKLFKDNDQLKTNTALQMKDAGIEFKTI